MSWSTELFQTSKPIIGLLHLDPLPGDPFYKGSMEQIIENATHDLKALQNGGVDGVLMTNEFSGPFFTDTPKPVFRSHVPYFRRYPPSVYGSIRSGNHR